MSHKIDPLAVFACDTITVSDVFVLGIIFERITTSGLFRKETVVSVAEYRHIIGDESSTDEHILERLQYLEAFCRNIIKPELQKYYDKGKETISR